MAKKASGGKMPRPIQKQMDLQDAAGHVSYEIEMLIYCAAHIGGWHSSPSSVPVGNPKNMALESFLLHYRNLRAFLCPSLQTLSNTDIIASDFMGDPNAKDLADAGKLGVDKQRLDGMLSHLTYRRAGYIAAGNQSWYVAAMLATMLLELEAFVSNSLPPVMRSWFPSALTLAQHRTRLISLPGAGSTTTTLGV
jgi:hypothetical protein